MCIRDRRSQDGDLAKRGATQEGDPSNPPPPVETLQPLHWRPERGAEGSTKEEKIHAIEEGRIIEEDRRQGDYSRTYDSIRRRRVPGDSRDSAYEDAIRTWMEEEAGRRIRSERGRIRASREDIRDGQGDYVRIMTTDSHQRRQVPQEERYIRPEEAIRNMDRRTTEKTCQGDLDSTTDVKSPVIRRRGLWDEDIGVNSHYEEGRQQREAQYANSGVGLSRGVSSNYEEGRQQRGAQYANSEGDWRCDFGVDGRSSSRGGHRDRTSSPNWGCLLYTSPSPRD